MIDPLDEQVPITVSAYEVIDGVEVPIGEPRERTISLGAMSLLAGLPDETSVALTQLRASERNANEQGEPSTSGTWYLLSVSDLLRDGFDAIEVHYPDTDDGEGPPNAIVLHKGVFGVDAG